MKKITKIFFILVLSIIFILPVDAKEKEKITIYFFHGDGCPHCAEEERFFKNLKNDYIKIEDYEVWYNTENEEFMNKVKSIYGIEQNGVPLTIIGDTYFIGYNHSLGNIINRAIDYYLEYDNYVDHIAEIKNGNTEIEINDEFSKIEDEISSKFTIDVPILGKVNLKNISISGATVLIGLVDGFNPCAMWVLLFLISILVGMKDKKRMWTLGLAFLISSALVYMLIMFSWLNIVVRVSTSTIIRYLIGAVAIVGGVINLRSYIKSKDSGCSVVDDKKRKKILNRIKQFTSEKSFILALFGVIALAVSVNIVELACSAGLPLIFTQLLALNDVKGLAGLYYTLVYVLFFLMDDLVIFFIAMFTMNVTGISTKYNKYSHLIGGILMIVIGLLLLFKYDLLTFGF